MAASVELHSPARETRTGTCLLNAISDNLVGHRRESAKTKRPLIGYVSDVWSTQEPTNQQRAVRGSAPAGVQALGTRGTGPALPPSAWPPGPHLSRATGPEPARSRVKEGSREQLRTFRDAGLRPAARLPRTRHRRALTSCPPRAQRSGNSRIVVDVSSVGAPHKPGGLPQWTRCAELVPKLIVRVRFPSPAPHAKSIAGQSNRAPSSTRVSRGQGSLCGFAI